MKTKPRDVIFLAALCVVFVLTAWRMNNPRGPQPVGPALIGAVRTAPAFELYDQQSRLVQLDAFLHRHHILLAFFDAGVNSDELDFLQRLREFHPALKENGVLVLGVTNTLPQQIRAPTRSPFPFPVLADISAGQPGSASAIWGCARPGSAGQSWQILHSVFLIERSGHVAWEGDFPQPVPDPQQLIRRLIEGD